jgi:hypothetical protein
MNPLLYVPLAKEHFHSLRVYPQGRPVDAGTGQHLDGATEGTVWMTTASVSIPTVSPLLDLPAIAHEHSSATRPEAISGVVALIEGVVIPTATATLADVLATGCYPATLTLLDVEYAGIEGPNVVGMVRLRALPGQEAPTVSVSISSTAPAGALAAVEQLVDVFMLPALRAELGCR